MATIDEIQQQLTALQARVDAITAPPEDYYQSRYTGEEIDNGISRAFQVGENLLDNWYFVDPINQRGKTEYSGTGYTIDRWRITDGNASASIIDGAVRVILNTSQSANRICFRQSIESPLTGTFTFSILCKINSGEWRAGGLGTPDNSGTLKDGLNSITVSRDSTKSTVYLWTQSLEASIDIIAVKMELGSVQTLAHQDADGSWVLNDPPPNKALELAKCQRYYRKLQWLGGGTDFAPIRVFLPINPPMRTTPSVVFTSSGDGVSTVEARNAESIDITVAGGNYAVLDIRLSADL